MPVSSRSGLGYIRTNPSLWISIIFILGKSRFYYSKTDCIGMRSRASLNCWTRTLSTAKTFSAELAGVIYKKKFTIIIFRNFMKLSRCKRKMKIWENCNANGKMTKNNCLSHWTRDISSWSFEEQLHWYIITDGLISSLSDGN